MRELRRWLAMLWRWSWIVTFPLAVFFIYWALATWSRYRDFGLRHVADPFPASLYNIGKMEFRHLLHRMKLAVTPGPELSESLRVVDLFLETAKEKRLGRHLPFSGRTYVKAHLLYPNGRLYPVKVKYRGDYAQHWGHYKKSTRVRTKKSRLFEGMRAFNLNAPKFEESLNNHLAYRLAADLGLLAPRSEMVFLRVNGENRGIHLLVEQIEELTLRANGRMPGDIYVGELVGPDRYRGASNRVFENPGLWEKIAVNNHYPPESRAPLLALTQALENRQEAQGHQQLMDLLDLDVWARFALFELLTQSFHFDEGHNWRLFFDPAKSVFEPIIWDPVGWHPSWQPPPGEKARLDIVLTELHRGLTSDYGFLLARHRAVARFFETGSDQRFLEKAHTVLLQLKQAVAKDPYLTSHFQFFTPEEAQRAMDELMVRIEKTFADIRAGYLLTEGKVQYALTPAGDLALEVRGRRPIQAVNVTFAQEITGPVAGAIAYLQGDQWVEVDVSGAMALRGNQLALEVPLLARHLPFRAEGNRLRAEGLRAEPAYYEWRWRGLGPNPEILEVRVDRGNRERAPRAEQLTPLAFENGFGVVRPKPLELPEIWEGVVTIPHTRRISNPLVIRPGTVVRLGEQVSLVIRGRLSAEGTAAAPIRFERESAAGEPWGVVALQGRGADGSRLAHCYFGGGSGFKRDLFEYSAMFSVHHVADVSVRACRFSDNHRVDDMVHAVYADIVFEDCRFQGAPFDAVDLDICKSTLRGCRFTASGNDGLDLMTTEAVVRDCLFQNNRDKGISVGESSKLLAVNNLFKGNHIGSQIKDGSKAVFYNAHFIANRQALHAYKKNWRYAEGGFAWVYKARLEHHPQPVSADAASRIWLYDAFLADTALGDKRVEANLADDRHPRQAAEKRFWRFPREERLLPSWFQKGWRAVDPAIRGAHGFADAASF